MTPEQLRRAADVVTAARKTIESQSALIKEQGERIAMLETGLEMLGKYARAVVAHNAECDRQCGKGTMCGYEELLKRTGRRCRECPVLFKVDAMPTEGSA